MMAVNTPFKIGLVIGLAGAIFPVIRRYSNWSTPGTVIVGSVFALIAAIWFVETPLSEEEALAAELARGATCKRSPTSTPMSWCSRGLCSFNP